MESKAFYRYNKIKLIDNYRKITNLFCSFHQNFRIAYSFKTNSYYPILEAMQKEGAYAEVVSPEEYADAKNAGFEVKNIIYNGVCKTKETIEDCLENNGKVNIDNKEDLEIILNYAKYKPNVKVGLRLNFDIGTAIKSRFGITALSSLYNKIKELDSKRIIEVTGLHCHFTMASDIKYWSKRAERLTFYSRDFPHIKYLDFGGNMYSMSYKNIMEQYRNILCENVDQNKELIIEAGTPLVEDVFDVVSHIIHIKEGFIFVDCSIVDIGLAAKYDKCRIQIIKNNNIPEEFRTKVRDYNIVGYTCLENDILKKSFTGTIAIGDTVIFKGCGAYSYCWANDFIKPKLNVLSK